ncbi:MAG: dihydrolipoyl dehydrogenase [Candidatus Acididesulfobacter diazotrophicus]|uniref:Dihydrolipoyl dehydrogenase n=1 Tax=Candidatus Acididesulfobacter diazotrophicus TaxID=2597226 RepID=A0A519BM70_9DELT|nr:MAG: dihydrolipoyl dehydrogenase [Candidatus Acididesulfobacter diazotrophicus]
MENFDICVIGGGPAGYVAALKSALNGMKIAVIEKDKLGGTCLNRGCIPTKVLYSKAKFLNSLKSGVSGFHIDKYNYNYEDIINYKDEVVSTLVSGVGKLLKARNVSVFNGAAFIVSAPDKKNNISGVIKIVIKSQENNNNNNNNNNKELEISASNIIVATGSSPAMIPAFHIDHNNIITSDEILNIKSIPKDIAIIGAGVIGCEFANIFNEFGSKVTMLELLPAILSTEDKEISKFTNKILASKDIEIRTSIEVDNISAGGKGAIVSLKTGEKIEAEKVLVSIGRILNTNNLGLKEIGVELDSKGKIKTDVHNETNIAGIYACGDIIDGPMLAHKASYDGIIASENIAGRKREKNYSVLPWSIYVNPPIGTIGLKEGDKELESIKYRVGRFSYGANGMALAMEEKEGFLKVLTEDETGKIIGATGIGADMPELIAEITAIMHFNGNIKDAEFTIHSHPTLSEIVPEAVLDSIGEAIHKYNPRMFKK